MPEIKKASEKSDIKSQKASRLEWVDYAKGIAIILVVYRHILIGVQRTGLEVDSWLINANEIVYSFRMPLFFVLSGLFVSKSIAKRDSFKLFSVYKFNTILYPYLVWGIIQISIQIVLSNFTNADRDLSDFGLLLIHPRAIDQLWYLYALFNVSILFYTFYRIFKLSTLYMIIIGLILFGLSTFVKEYSLIHDTLYFLIFFILGHAVRAVLLDSSKADLLHSFKPFLVALPVFLLSQLYWLNHREMNLYLFALVAIWGTFFVFTLSFLLSKYEVLPILKLVGKHSLHVYLMHLLVVSAVRIVFTKLLGIETPIFILLVGWLMGVAIPIIVYQTIKSTKLRLLFSLEKN